MTKDEYLVKISKSPLSEGLGIKPCSPERCEYDNCEGWSLCDVDDPECVALVSEVHNV